MSYRVEFTGAAARKLKKLDDVTKRRIVDALAGLARDPYAAHDVKKLSGRNDTYRLRVGDYRVIYQVSDKAITITVIEVAHRREAYR